MINHLRAHHYRRKADQAARQGDVLSAMASHSATMSDPGQVAVLQDQAVHWYRLEAKYRAKARRCSRGGSLRYQHKQDRPTIVWR